MAARLVILSERSESKDLTTSGLRTVPNNAETAVQP